MKALWDLIWVTSVYSSVVGITIILIKKLLKNKINAKWGYLIWLVLIIKFIIPFGPQSDISLFNKLNIKNEYTNNLNVEDVNYQSQKNNNYTQYNKVNNDKNIENSKLDNENNIILKNVSKVSFEDIVPIIGLIGALNIAAIFITSHYLLHKRIKSNNILSDNNINEILNSCKERLNIRKDLKVVLNNFIKTPSLVGIINPKILIPKSMSDLSDKELEYILLHELSHYKRKDIIVNYLLLIIQTIHWFNPIVWYCFRIIKEDMELATDEKVLLILEDNEHNDYGKAILAVLERIKYSGFTPGIIGMIDDKKGVEKRIKNIKGMKFLKGKKGLFTLVGISIVSVLSILLLTSSNTTLADDNLTQLQNSYFEIVSKDIKGKSIPSNELKTILPELKYIQNSGLVSLADEENENKSSSYSTRIYEYKLDNEVLTISYMDDEENSKVLNKIDSIQLNTLDENKNITLSLYYNKLGKNKGQFDIAMYPKYLKEQEETFNLIDKSNDMYDLYFKIAKLTEDNEKVKISDIEKILGNKLEKLGSIENGINTYSFSKNEFTIFIDYNEKENKCYQVGIEGNNKKKTILYYSKDESHGIQTWKYINNIKEQKNILNILTQNNYISKNVSRENNILKEANSIATKHGYTIKPETEDYIMNGDSEVFELMKKASVESGYSLEVIENTDNINIVGYELVEKSKYENGNGRIHLCLLLGNENKVIGAFLDYGNYNPGITPIQYKDYINNK